MAVARYWQQQFVEMMTSLLRDGILDEQFQEFRKLQDESNPDFVNHVISLFFNDSEKLLDNLANALHQQALDSKQIDTLVHQFKGSSASVGAKRVKDACVQFKNSRDQNDLQGCLSCLEHMKHEFFLFKNQLQTLFKVKVGVFLYAMGEGRPPSVCCSIINLSSIYRTTYISGGGNSSKFQAMNGDDLIRLGEVEYLIPRLI